MTIAATIHSGLIAVSEAVGAGAACAWTIGADPIASVAGAITIGVTSGTGGACLAAGLTTVYVRLGSI